MGLIMSDRRWKRKRVSSPKPQIPKFDTISQIMEFLKENDMETYSVKISPDGSCCLLRGGSTNPFKNLDDLFYYIRKTFRE